MMTPRVEYSDTADAVYITFNDDVEFSRTRSLDDRRMIDVAVDGTIIGIELLDVSTGIDYAGLPEREQVEAAIAAAGLRFEVLT